MDKGRGFVAGLAYVCLCFLTSSALAWTGTVPGATHELMADRVLDHPSLAPYVARF
jgi:hypothetical protein